MAKMPVSDVELLPSAGDQTGLRSLRRFSQRNPNLPTLVLKLSITLTFIRISEAMGLKWEDIDYQNKQINLRRVWVSDTIVEHLKTDDSEAPVPLTDLLAKYLLDWHRETVYGKLTDWVFASARRKGKTPRSSSVLTWDHLRPGSDCRRGEAQEGATVRVPQLPARTGELAGQPRNGRKDGSRTATPLQRFHHARAVRSPCEFVDDGGAGLDDAGVTARIEDRSIGYRGLEKRRQATFCRREKSGLPSTTGFEPATSSVSRDIYYFSMTYNELVGFARPAKA